MIHAAGSGHPGTCFSSADYLAFLWSTYRIARGADSDAASPLATSDRFVLSNGHAAPLLYAWYIEQGLLPEGSIGELRRVDSPLQGHPSAVKLPIVDVGAGSLGQGLSIANGLALGFRYQYRGRDDTVPFVHCNLGDGELQEGQVWEAAMTTARYALDNVVVSIDRNDTQIDGRVEEVMALEPLADKWRAFGWNVREIDGHDMAAIADAWAWARGRQGQPRAVIFDTLMMYGVPDFEGLAEWHGRAPDGDELSTILSSLEGTEP